MTTPTSGWSAQTTPSSSWTSCKTSGAWLHLVRRSRFPSWSYPSTANAGSTSTSSPKTPRWCTPHRASCAKCIGTSCAPSAQKTPWPTNSTGCRPTPSASKANPRSTPGATPRKPSARRTRRATGSPNPGTRAQTSTTSSARSRSRSGPSLAASSPLAWLSGWASTYLAACWKKPKAQATPKP